MRARVCTGLLQSFGGSAAIFANLVLLLSATLALANSHHGSGHFHQLCLEEERSGRKLQAGRFTNQYRDAAFAYYNSSTSIFGNKADFKGIRRIVDMLLNDGLCMPSTVFLVGGVNNGQLASEILKLCPNIAFHGFEVQAEVAQKTAELLKKLNKNANVYHLGMSDQEKDGLSVVGQMGSEGAGLFQVKHSPYLRNYPQQTTKVSTVMLSRWAPLHNITTVTYAVIDTEGHEPKVIRGMELHKEESQKLFPLFQFEVGGTWADERHGDDPWNIEDTVKHIEDAGYEVYMIGEEYWMRVYHSFFTDQYFNRFNAGNGKYAEGNILCVHNKFSLPSLRAAIRAIHPPGVSSRGTLYCN